MSKILIVAEHDGTKLNASTAKSVTCATKIAGASIDVLVLAANGSAVAAEAAALAGVSKVLVADNPANAEPGTIRKDFAINIEENSSHGSDAPETAAFEIPYFFSALELV